MSTPVEPTDVTHLCSPHYRPLHAHIRRKLPQRSDADDVVQESWLRLIKAAASGLLGDAIITALPSRSRQAFLLARVEWMGLAEIGRQLGITRQTAHGDLLRALVAVQQVPQA
ncbi:RNA polymerase sigma factor [Stenotrophomonas sp. NPDC077659]|uniref:RNA polymerase sigma factor n=1 Tax=Stenotrophomonas sp. NPDC077659 TaxID=3390694 RepID=UPI003D071C6F